MSVVRKYTDGVYDGQTSIVRIQTLRMYCTHVLCMYVLCVVRAKCKVLISFGVGLCVCVCVCVCARVCSHTEFGKHIYIHLVRSCHRFFEV